MATLPRQYTPQFVTFVGHECIAHLSGDTTRPQCFNDRANAERMVARIGNRFPFWFFRLEVVEIVDKFFIAKKG